MYEDKDAALAGGPRWCRFTDLRALKALADDGYANRNWNDTTNLVITGKAGLQVMGDWARGESAAAGMKGVEDFGCMIGLNEDSLLVSTDGDIFVFFKQPTRSRGGPEASRPAHHQPRGPGRLQQRQGLDAGPRRRRHIDRRPCMQKALKAVETLEDRAGHQPLHHREHQPADQRAGGELLLG
jgi:glucose/mannose transport system substrate-binding protein